MPNDLVNQAPQYTPAQLELIKSTIAKGATDDELKLFLYRARNMGLDPLKPGQLYFLKYGTSPGTIVIGIEGMRSRAAATGKHRGTKRGVTLDNNGKLIGAWAEVYREGWLEPAREEVLLSEYNTGKAMWAKMPAQMIKKVAEVAALRMAFPDEIGGVYAQEEMDQAEPTAALDAHFEKPAAGHEEINLLAEEIKTASDTIALYDAELATKIVKHAGAALGAGKLDLMRQIHARVIEILQDNVKGEKEE